MPSTIRDILCGENRWSWDAEQRNFIKFNADGTGEVRFPAIGPLPKVNFLQLQSVIELSTFLGAEFDWKSHGSLDTIVEAKDLYDKNFHMII